MKEWTQGAKTTDIQEYELRHRKTAREAAAAGFVLLKNEGGLLPLPKTKKVALYGSGAVFPIKGGSGSGDVNSRETVSLWQGMKAAGYEIVNEAWLEGYRQDYTQARLDWRDKVWKAADANPQSGLHALWFAYTGNPFIAPAGKLPETAGGDAALYVLSRTAGEAADRFEAPGDYYLTEEEDAFLARLNDLYEDIALLINSGSLIDLNFVERYPHIRAILYVNQPGMEAGSAMADVISGQVTPSGKLTDTWVENYADYPNSATFSHNNGNVLKEFYTEGVYVGYRYFDTFEKPVRYPFGFGLSYTAFDIRFGGLRKEGETLLFTVSVTNTGKEYAGKEVVQVYAACPQEKRSREFRRLIGFQKTGLLAPGASETLQISVPLRMLASYDEALPGWTVDKGEYIFFVGADIAESKPVAKAVVPAELLLEKTEHICPLREELKEIEPDAARLAARRDALLAGLAGAPCVEITEAASRTVRYDGAYEDTPQAVRDFVDTLSMDQLILLATGDVSAGQGSQIGAAGSRVPGSAAQTSPCAIENGLPDIVLADGPAGLRLNREYHLADGYPVREPFGKSIENGFLYRGQEPEGESRYQFCTAIPVGTLLAQSWDPAVVQACGQAVAEEMKRFGVELWLAPGMNIHRNPLCGRNFEYYSEDPVLAGLIATAMARGVEATKGCGVTIKHYACNNQEDNRNGSDSILSERTLREIYLRGFEIAVKEAQPASIMTSYNLINGIHAANNYDICTKAARNEWGFKGMIMTDWSTTNHGPACTASGCMRAGNDIVMPGQPMDHEDIRAALADGSLKLEDLKRSVCRTAALIRRLCD